MKNHSEDLIAQIKKLKTENISQEESPEEFHQKEVDLQDDFNKKLLQKNEENSRLKILNQGLTEQIKKLKFLHGFHKRLKYLIVTQITEVDTTNIKLKQKR